MSFRTVVVTTHCKLDFRMNYMEIRQADTKKRIYLDEIGVLIIENTAVSLTVCLLSELMRRKVKVIFCDSCHNPQAELLAYYGSHDTSRKVRQQLAWPEEVKGAVWTAIVTEKICRQREFLAELGHEQEAGLLASYVAEMSFRDVHNREGMAAKVYFNALFGMDFNREADSPINAALNYGYTVVLALVNREVTALGYITQLGLSHSNVFNAFNLSCDLIEPLRILVDRWVYASGLQAFEAAEKHRLLEILQSEVMINGQRQVFTTMARLYVRSVFHALEEADVSKICFYQR